MILILFKNCKFILYIYSYSEDLEQNTKRKFFFHASPKKKESMKNYRWEGNLYGILGKKHVSGKFGGVSLPLRAV